MELHFKDRSGLNDAEEFYEIDPLANLLDDEDDLEAKDDLLEESDIWDL